MVSQKPGTIAYERIQAWDFTKVPEQAVAYFTEPEPDGKRFVIDYWGDEDAKDDYSRNWILVVRYPDESSLVFLNTATEGYTAVQQSKEGPVVAGPVLTV